MTKYSIFAEKGVMNIGNKIKTLRISKKIEPIILAEKLGVSLSTCRRYERNESVPDLNMLEKMANVFNIELSELIKDDHYNFYNHKNKGDNIGNVVINHLLDKLIEQYEKRLDEKDKIIEGLRRELGK